MWFILLMNKSIKLLKFTFYCGVICKYVDMEKRTKRTCTPNCWFEGIMAFLIILAMTKQRKGVHFQLAIEKYITHTQWKQSWQKIAPLIHLSWFVFVGEHYAAIHQHLLHSCILWNFHQIIIELDGNSVKNTPW